MILSQSSRNFWLVRKASLLGEGKPTLARGAGDGLAVATSVVGRGAMGVLAAGIDAA